MRALILLLTLLPQEPPKLSLEGRPLPPPDVRPLLDRLDRVVADRKAAAEDGNNLCLARFVRYFSEYDQALGRDYERAVTFGAVIEEARRHRLVVLGDVHDSPDCRRNEMALLRELAKTRKIVLGLECVPVQSRAVLREFMEGRRSAEDTAAALADSWWFFGTKEYLWTDLLRFAKDGRFRVEPLEDRALCGTEVLYTGRTAERDRAAAAKIAALLETLGDDETLCVVYGYYHLLGKDHLGPRLGGDRILITPFAPVQHLRHGAGASPLKLRQDLFYLPCAESGRLTRLAEVMSVETATRDLERLWLTQKYREPRQ